MKITITYSENNTINEALEEAGVNQVSFDTFGAASKFLYEAAKTCRRGVGGYDKTGFQVSFEEAGGGFVYVGRVELKHPADGYASIVNVMVRGIQYKLKHPELIKADKRALELEDAQEMLSIILEQVETELVEG